MKTETFVAFSIRIPEELKSKLEEIAIKQRRSLNNQIITILEEAVMNLKNQNTS